MAETEKERADRIAAETAEYNRRANAAGYSSTTTTTTPGNVGGIDLEDWGEDIPAEILGLYIQDEMENDGQGGVYYPGPRREPRKVEQQGTSTGENWSDGAYPTITEYPRGDANKFFPVGEAPEGPLRQGPQYSNIDYQLILNGMTSSELASLELLFQEAGMIDSEAMLSGGLSRGALLGHFKNLIMEADANRNTWEDQLNSNIEGYQEWLKENPEEEPKTWAQLNPFVAPAEMKPDYATMAQNVKDNVRGQLGRSATTGEMELLTSQLSGSYHDAWKQNQYDPALATWEANSRAHETESAQSAGTFQAVDPQARFDETFDERYEGELGHRRRVDKGKSKTQSLFGSFDMLARSI